MKNQFLLKNWVLAARPKTLSAAIAPVILGTALAWHDFHIDIITSLVTFLSAICIQIGTNFSNDISDFLKGADTKERLGPIRATQSGLLTIKQLKIGTIIIFSIAIHEKPTNVEPRISCSYCKHSCFYTSDRQAYCKH